MPSFDEVIEAVRSERIYQVKTWPSSTDLPTTGEVSLARHYLAKFDAAYAAEADCVDSDVPEECLNILRKLTAILIRAQENHGTRRREGI